MSDQFVRADEYLALKRAHEALKEEHARLHRATKVVQSKSYEEGRDDARRELMRRGSQVQQGDGIAHLTLPDNGGAIQFHTVTEQGRRPLVGGVLTPSPDFSLRIWGPPDESGSYGVHEQGGGNLTDFSMGFDLTPRGIVIHSMETTGVRTRWDRPTPDSPSPTCAHPSSGASPTADSDSAVGTSSTRQEQPR